MYYDAACLHAVRMRRDAFRILCQSLKKYYDLAVTENISIKESVTMFLSTCGHNEVQRTVARNFGRNQETVNRKFHEVLNAMERLACDQIKTPTVSERKQYPRNLRTDRRYWPYFQGFIGAIDGTHVPVIAPTENRRTFWHRFGEASLNIMAICDLDMLFTYIWNGAPGSVHDSRVLAIAQQTSQHFPKPPNGKYYLVDSEYANKKGYLAPYRGNRREVVRYHLGQFHDGPPPRNKHELFNRWHASLCSVIERTFGIWKKKWRVVKELPRYKLETQKRLVFVTVGLHNFIRRSNILDDDFNDDASENENVQGQQDEDATVSNEIEEVETTTNGAHMAIVRNQIVDMLWVGR